MSKINNAVPTSYATAVAMLKGKRERKLSANTSIVLASDDSGVAVKLHATLIVVFTKDGRIILNSGGWRTLTTKARINAALRDSGCYVYQHNFDWFVARSGEHTPRVVDFEDGMTVAGTEPKPEPEPAADFTVENHGTVAMVRPLSEAAQAWVSEHVNLEPWQWMGNGFACEPRYVSDLVAGMLDDGLVQA